MDSGAEFSKCCVAVAVQVYRVLVNGTLPTIYRTIQYNILKKATKLPRYQHQSMVEHFKYNISSKTSDGATINQKKELGKRVLGFHEQSSNHSLSSLDI